MYAVLIFYFSVTIMNLYDYKIYTLNPELSPQFLSLKRQILVISGAKTPMTKYIR